MSRGAGDGVETGGFYEKSQESGKILVQMKVFLNQSDLESAGSWGSGFGR